MSLSQLAWQDVAAGYGGTTIIENIHLEVRRGERVGILGRNGAGKTTTLAAAMGFAELRRGAILFDGQNVSGLKPSGRSRRGLGWVPQTRDIFKSLTVEENLKAGLQGGSQTRLKKAYDMFPRLHERRANLGSELSGGEQQMLTIARTLMGAPSIMLLDEPLEGLSPIVAQEVMKSIERLTEEEGLGVILVEQHVSAVMRFCQRILVLESGHPTFYGETEALKLEPSLLQRAIGIAR
jgi:branched-chain amino acid transport system ATP-binding protein